MGRTSYVEDPDRNGVGRTVDNGKRRGGGPIETKRLERKEIEQTREKEHTRSTVLPPS